MKKTTKKRKVRYDRILIFLIGLILILVVFILFFNLKITNIYILNNDILNDQEIIQLAGISDYPSTIKNTSSMIAERLKQNVLIKNVKVYKKNLTILYIEIEENTPLFYYEGQTVLKDGRTTTDEYIVPTVINEISDNCYDEFVKQMSILDKSVLNMISEIKYTPLVEGDTLFLLTMTDGNYVYVDLDTDMESFNNLNKYLTIKEGLPNKKGILELDLGINFKYEE